MGSRHKLHLCEGVRVLLICLGRFVKNRELGLLSPPPKSPPLFPFHSEPLPSCLPLLSGAHQAKVLARVQREQQIRVLLCASSRLPLRDFGSFYNGKKYAGPCSTNIVTVSSRLPANLRSSGCHFVLSGPHFSHHLIKMFVH